MGDDKKTPETPKAPVPPVFGEEKKAPETAKATDEPTEEVEFSGAPGSAYSIRGAHFGATKGTVLLNGAPLPVSAWNDERVKGAVPPDAKPGDIEVLTTDNHRFTGHYGSKK